MRSLPDPAPLPELATEQGLLAPPASASFEALAVRLAPLLVALLIAVFAGLCFKNAAASYLHPDEAQQVLRARGSSLGDAFRYSLTQSHPPLLILILYAARKISYSPLFLRSITIAASAGALAFAFLWLRRAFDDAVAVAGVAFLASSPGVLTIAMQVRQYGVLLFFICAALYCMERLLAQRSIRWTIAYSLAIYGTLFTFYGGAWVVIALGLYLPLRFWRERTPRKVIATWAGLQAIGAALGAWLYVVHITLLRRDINWAANGFLKGSYQTGGDTWSFIRRGTWRVFQHFAHGLPALEHPWAGNLAMALFALGIVVLLAGRRERRDYALLLLLPIALACLGGVERWLPYGGTRHVSYLAPFIAAGVGIAVATLLPRLWMVLLLVVLIVPVRFSHAAPQVAMRRLAIGNIAAAVKYLQDHVEPGQVLFMDRQAFYITRQYWDDESSQAGYVHSPYSNESRFGEQRVIFPAGLGSWTFRPESLLRTIAIMGRASEVADGTPVWIVSHAVAPRPPLDAALPEDASYRRFGAIEVIGMPFRSRPRRDDSFDE